MFHFQPLINNKEANTRYAKAAKTLVDLWNDMDQSTKAAVFDQINNEYNLNATLSDHEACINNLRINLNKNWKDFI